MNARPIQLTSDEWKTLLQVLIAQVLTAIIWAFGSRALGTAQAISDLDLLISEPALISLERLADLKDALLECDLPFRVDVLDYTQVSTELLQGIQDSLVQILPLP